MSRADKNTLEQKKREIYSDFLINFDQNPFTGVLARVTNEESVAQSLKNITLTNRGERFYNSNKGSRIRSSLFELFDSGMFDAIKLDLQDMYSYYEPRAIINDIIIQPETLDLNSLNVAIIFSIINIPGQNFQVSLNVQRIR
jgi:phage baseplate assembly protein W